MATEEGYPLPFVVKARPRCPFCSGTGMQTITVQWRVQGEHGHADCTILRKTPCPLCTTEGDWQAYEDLRRRMEAEA